jgi:hypothetical protein
LFSLGYMYEHGVGTERNFTKAKKYYYEMFDFAVNYMVIGTSFPLPPSSFLFLFYSFLE